MRRANHVTLPKTSDFRDFCINHSLFSHPCLQILFDFRGHLKYKSDDRSYRPPKSLSLLLERQNIGDFFEKARKYGNVLTKRRDCDCEFVLLYHHRRTIIGGNVMSADKRIFSNIAVYKEALLHYTDFVNGLDELCLLGVEKQQLLSCFSQKLTAVECIESLKRKAKNVRGDIVFVNGAKLVSAFSDFFLTKFGGKISPVCDIPDCTVALSRRNILEICVCIGSVIERSEDKRVDALFAPSNDTIDVTLSTSNAVGCADIFTKELMYALKSGAISGEILDESGVFAITLHIKTSQSYPKAVLDKGILHELLPLLLADERFLTVTQAIIT